MDFSVIFQLRTKKFWWMDVILYFVLSLFLAALFSYFIFLVKNVSQREEIQKTIISFQGVGTAQQKLEEKEVLNYQKKINDFSNLLKNHDFASHVFGFMESQTIPNVWYKQFNLNAKNSEIQLSGEADNMDALSRQVAIFENENNRKYIKSFGTLNSTLSQSSRVDFSTNLVMNDIIFDYVPELIPVGEITTEPEENNIVEPENQETSPENNTPAENTPNAETQPSSAEKSKENFITSFRLLLKPEVVGVIDQKKYEITLTVPAGTNVKNLISSIITSPKATVTPASKVSQDFSAPVAYRVTAEDGTIQTYQVKVVVQSPPQIVQEPVKPESSVMIILMYVGIGIVIVSGIILLVWRKMSAKAKNKNQTYAN